MPPCPAQPSGRTHICPCVSVCPGIRHRRTRPRRPRWLHRELCHLQGKHLLTHQHCLPGEGRGQSTSITQSQYQHRAGGMRVLAHGAGSGWGPSKWQHTLMGAQPQHQHLPLCCSRGSSPNSLGLLRGSEQTQLGQGIRDPPRAMSLLPRSVCPAGALPGCPGSPDPVWGHRQTPALILTLGSCSAPEVNQDYQGTVIMPPGTILCSSPGTGGQGWMDGWRLDCRSTSTWAGQEQPSPSPTSSSPVLGGQQGGISQFSASTGTL